MSPARSLVDLDVAPDQRTWPVRVGIDRDAKRVTRAGGPAVVDIDGQRFTTRDCGPDDVGHANDRGVGTQPGGNDQLAEGCRLYAHVSRFVVVLQVPGWHRAAYRLLHHEAE